MAKINLAPYSVVRWFDGTSEYLYVIEDESGKRREAYETREEAEAERNRLNSKRGLDELGI